MSRILNVLAVVLCLAVFGAPAANALESRTVASAQDGDKGKKKNQRKKQQERKKGKKGGKKNKKQGKKGKKHGKKRKNGKKNS